MKIIQAKKSHLPQILELWNEFFGHHEKIDPIFKRAGDARVHCRKFFSKLIESNDALVLVAFENGEAIGYATAKIDQRVPVFRDKKYGAIYGMFVKPALRRKGVGEKMLAKIKKWFQARNIHRIELAVVSKNMIGRSFWKKHGFNDSYHRLYLEIPKKPKRMKTTSSKRRTAEIKGRRM